MRFLVLIYESESNPPGPEDEMDKWFSITEEMTSAGVLVAGEALHPTNTAVTVRRRGDKVLRTDGPFAETKEQLGGFYLLDCADLEEAVRWALKMPNVGRGSIEVRPVVDFSAEQ